MTTVSVNGRGSRGQGQIIVRLLLGVVAMLTCLWSYATPAHALPAPQASSCAGVWVIVDYGALGGTATACAGSYSTGTAALRSAGFALTLDAGLIVRINGVPTTPNVQENYWSYWHATRQPDGSYSSWSYSNVGPASYYPTAVDAEGWRYQPVNGGYVAPGVAPPKQTATTQAPATIAPAPATTAKTTVATRATTTGAVTKATTAAVATGSTVPDPSSTQASPSGIETPALSTVPIDSASVIAPRAPTSTSTNSLLGGVITISAIAVAAAAMLIWRKRVAARV
ncbi:MAG TPA: hypothetical protein VIL68_05625 [Propionibacteriaceae bacterium]